MVEIEWSSLFSSFFRMARARIECKDATKIPSKRLFDLKRNLYLVQFKVEKHFGDAMEGFEDDGGDNSDPPSNDEDPGVEEID
jgi:hypothetical protein